jgi:hypothetical protein
MEEKKNRDTVGKIATDIIQNDPATTDVNEQGEHMTRNYLAELYKSILDYKVKNINIDFFVEVQTVKPRILSNIIRNYFIPRLSCPTPNYDQTVWQYKYKDDGLFLVWTIPNREHCFKLLENAAIIDPSIRELTDNVIAFAQGDLYRLCKKLNNEEKLESLVVLKETPETEDDGRKQSRFSESIIPPNRTIN